MSGGAPGNAGASSGKVYVPFAFQQTVNLLVPAQPADELLAWTRAHKGEHLTNTTPVIELSEVPCPDPDIFGMMPYQGSSNVGVNANVLEMANKYPGGYMADNKYRVAGLIGDYEGGFVDNDGSCACVRCRHFVQFVGFSDVDNSPSVTITVPKASYINIKGAGGGLQYRRNRVWHSSGNAKNKGFTWRGIEFNPFEKVIYNHVQYSFDGHWMAYVGNGASFSSSKELKFGNEEGYFRPTQVATGFIAGTGAGSITVKMYEDSYTHLIKTEYSLNNIYAAYEIAQWGTICGIYWAVPAYAYEFHHPQYPNWNTAPAS